MKTFSLLQVLAGVLSLANGINVDGIFNKINALLPPEGKFLESSSWNASVDWAIDGSKVKKGDTFSLTMPHVYKIFSVSESLDLIAHEEAFASCELLSGDNGKGSSSLKCTATGAVAGVKVSGTIEFGLIFDVGFSAAKVSLDAANCFKAGKNLITWTDGLKKLSTEIEISRSSQKLFSKDNSYFSLRKLVSGDKNEHLFVGPKCSSDGMHGSLEIQNKNKHVDFDCSSLETSFSGRLNDFFFPAKAGIPKGAKIEVQSCNKEKAVVNFLGTPANNRPFLNVLAALPQSEGLILVTYLYKGQCNGSPIKDQETHQWEVSTETQASSGRKTLLSGSTVTGGSIESETFKLQALTASVSNSFASSSKTTQDVPSSTKQGSGSGETKDYASSILKGSATHNGERTASAAEQTSYSQNVGSESLIASSQLHSESNFSNIVNVTQNGYTTSYTTECPESGADSITSSRVASFTLVTKTENGETTVYTTECPESVTSAAATSSASAPVTKTPASSVVTRTENGYTTVYTTECPESETAENTPASEPESSSIVIKTENESTTVYTTECSEHEASTATPKSVSSNPKASASSTIVTKTDNESTTVYTTECPESETASSTPAVPATETPHSSSEVTRTEYVDTTVFASECTESSSEITRTEHEDTTVYTTECPESSVVPATETPSQITKTENEDTTLYTTECPESETGSSSSAEPSTEAPSPSSKITKTENESTYTTECPESEAAANTPVPDESSSVPEPQPPVTVSSEINSENGAVLYQTIYASVTITESQSCSSEAPAASTSEIPTSAPANPNSAPESSPAPEPATEPSYTPTKSQPAITQPETSTPAPAAPARSKATSAPSLSFATSLLQQPSSSAAPSGTAAVSSYEAFGVPQAGGSHMAAIAIAACAFFF